MAALQGHHSEPTSDDAAHCIIGPHAQFLYIVKKLRGGQIRSVDTARSPNNARTRLFSILPSPRVRACLTETGIALVLCFDRSSARLTKF